MIRGFVICCALSLTSLSLVYGQSDPVRDVPPADAKKGNEKAITDTKNTKDIKSVPATNPGGAKPARISSSARPGTIRPNQPIKAGKPPVKGKPANTGKPPGK